MRNQISQITQRKADIALCCKLKFRQLDVRSLAVASRSRQSEKQPIVDELALIEHAHMGRSFRARRTVTTCHGSSDYYRTGLC